VLTEAGRLHGRLAEQAWKKSNEILQGIVANAPTPENGRW